jgi:hypothetical protein
VAFGPPLVIKLTLAGFLTEFGRCRSILGRSLELLCSVFPLCIQVGHVADLDCLFSYPGVVVLMLVSLVFQALLLATILTSSISLPNYDNLLLALLVIGIFQVLLRGS